MEKPALSVGVSPERIKNDLTEARDHVKKVVAMVGPQEDRRVLWGIIKKLEDEGRRIGFGWERPLPEPYPGMIESWTYRSWELRRQGLIDNEVPRFTTRELYYLYTIGEQQGWKRSTPDERGGREIEELIPTVICFGVMATRIELQNPDIKIEPLFNVPEILLRVSIDDTNTPASWREQSRQALRGFEEQNGLRWDHDGVAHVPEPAVASA